MAQNLLESFNKNSTKTRTASWKQSFLNTLKNVTENRALLAKIRNALLIYLLLMVVFRIFSFIAGVYLPEESYASFVAYFSFFILVTGGLFFSVYFPVKYSGAKANFNIKVPKIKRPKFKVPKIKIPKIKIKLPNIKFPTIKIVRRQKPRKPTKNEKELNQLLKQERKSFMKSEKEKHSLSNKLEKADKKCQDLEKDKKALSLITKSAVKVSDSNKKIDVSSFMGKLMPSKKEVVPKAIEVKEMPKIKLSAQNKQLSKKYRKLPKQGQPRIELFRNIARNVQKDGNSFSIAQIMEVLVELFPAEIDDDRREILKEIEEWVKEDPYTPLIKTEKGISYHRIIK